jgi:hypothetical protein
LVRLQKSLADDPGAYALRERTKQRADVASGAGRRCSGLV